MTPREAIEDAIRETTIEKQEWWEKYQSHLTTVWADSMLARYHRCTEKINGLHDALQRPEILQKQEIYYAIDAAKDAGWMNGKLEALEAVYRQLGDREKTLFKSLLDEPVQFAAGNAARTKEVQRIRDVLADLIYDARQEATDANAKKDKADKALQEIDDEQKTDS